MQTISKKNQKFYNKKKKTKIVLKGLKFHSGFIVNIFLSKFIKLLMLYKQYYWLINISQKKKTQPKGFK